MEIINFLYQYIVPTITLFFVAYKSVKAMMLRAKLDGKAFAVPSDEVKEAFRRAALAEASRLAGGRHLNLDVSWHGNVLEIKLLGMGEKKQ